MCIARSPRLVLAGLGVAASAYILVRTLGPGPIIHSDTHSYFRAAQSIARGTVLHDRDNVLMWFPPFYPALIALTTTCTGVADTSAATIINALAFGLNVYVPGAMVYELSGAFGPAVATSAAIAVSARFRTDHMEALSDPVFVLLVQICASALISYTLRRRPGSMFAAATAAGLAMLTRYIGFSAIIATAFTLVSVIVLRMPPYRRRRAFLLAAASLALWTLPNVLWIAKNLAWYGVVGGINREYVPGHWSASDITLKLFESVGSYWNLSTTPKPYHAMLGAIAVVMLPVLWCWPRVRARAAAADAISIYTAMAVVYSICLVVAASSLDAWRGEYGAVVAALMTPSSILLLVGTRRVRERPIAVGVPPSASQIERCQTMSEFTGDRRSLGHITGSERPSSANRFTRAPRDVLGKTEPYSTRSH